MAWTKTGTLQAPDGTLVESGTSPPADGDRLWLDTAEDDGAPPPPPRRYTRHFLFGGD